MAMLFKEAIGAKTVHTSAAIRGYQRLAQADALPGRACLHGAG